ncbi:uncharacterized protein LOC135391625 [Ornithodoros turicata]|uniref:uncharacterized protein LOC135391625 n=1 Tax=Ornithodoros turicata TaxID=34597 RepID=UPI00313A1F55
MWKSRGKTCSVFACRNCDRDLILWDEAVCQIHEPSLHKDCPCLRPFAMHGFPQGEKNKLVRQRWVSNLHRKDFRPGKSARVCSIHFVDGRPTKDNPYPTLHLQTLAQSLHKYSTITAEHLYARTHPEEMKSSYVQADIPAECHSIGVQTDPSDFPA